MPHNSPFAFAILTVLAVPFYRNVEHFAAILFIVSPIAYFYSSADEAVISLYTVLVIILLTQDFPKLQLQKAKGIIPRFLLIIIVFISYSLSDYVCLNGFFELIYIIVVSLIISVSSCFNIKKFVAALINESTVMLMIYIIIFSFFTLRTASGKLTISSAVLFLNSDIYDIMLLRFLLYSRTLI